MIDLAAIRARDGWWRSGNGDHRPFAATDRRDLLALVDRLTPVLREMMRGKAGSRNAARALLAEIEGRTE